MVGRESFSIEPVEGVFMRSLAIAVAFGLAGGSVPALADDTAWQPGTAFDWSGGFIGAQAGYIGGNGHFYGSGDTAHPEPDGFVGGFYTGANYQFGNDIVVGVEADIAWSGARDSVLVYDATGAPWPADYPVVQKIDWTGAMRARFGYAVDRWLPYVAGGVAFASVSQRLVGAIENFDANYTGWTAGVGAEYAVTDKIIVRADYRYSDLGSKSFEVLGAPPLNISLKTHSARLGIAFKF
ncbi:porin family protein [Shinella sp. CPCC 101442]|uniref:outer membrane protein n=1 Tax=Shinella sp. CPCC 101442 TaxID=2932265 RepID=UPI0021523497|nr:outer membrane protein [Shinella sp. CPCC 101442]MCR6500171.1 porin family protein [Shinella sp. CPCC 101442]